MSPTRRRTVRHAAVVAVLGPLCTSAAPAPPGYHLVWHDEFDAAAVDRGTWAFDAGTGFTVPAADGRPAAWANGWGNDELQCYTDRPANAYVADGALHVRAVHENYRGGTYTSARLRTGGRGGVPPFAHRYGRFEFRAKLPVGQGYWPALWLLPQDEHSGGWAASGEIDVMEARGGRPDEVQGTIHYGGTWPRNVWSGQAYRLPHGGTVADWHVYALDWDPGRLRWSVDGVTAATRDFWFSRTAGRLNPWPAPFDQPFYVVIDLAVGGRFGGNPTAATAFPQEMLVDYVRVYDRDGGPGPLQPPGAGKLTDRSVVRPATRP